MMPDPIHPPTRPGGAAAGAAAPAGLVIRGEAVHLGAAGDFRLIADAAGRHALRFGGALGEAHGWDGVAGWAVDWSGVSRGIALRELDLARMLALAIADLWRPQLAGDGVLVGFPGRPVLG